MLFPRLQFELGTVPIPKSVTKSRIEVNIDIFDFKLSPEDVAVLDGFQCGKRRVEFLDAKHSKFWPFAIEF